MVLAPVNISNDINSLAENHPLRVALASIDFEALSDNQVIELGESLKKIKAKGIPVNREEIRAILGQFLSDQVLEQLPGAPIVFLWNGEYRLNQNLTEGRALIATLKSLLSRLNESEAKMTAEKGEELKEHLKNLSVIFKDRPAVMEAVNQLKKRLEITYVSAENPVKDKNKARLILERLLQDPGPAQLNADTFGKIRKTVIFLDKAFRDDRVVQDLIDLVFEKFKGLEIKKVKSPKVMTHLGALNDLGGVELHNKGYDSMFGDPNDTILLRDLKLTPIQDKGHIKPELPPLSVLGSQAISAEADRAKYLLEKGFIGSPLKLEQENPEEEEEEDSIPENEVDEGEEGVEFNIISGEEPIAECTINGQPFYLYPKTAVDRLRKLLERIDTVDYNTEEMMEFLADIRKWKYFNKTPVLKALVEDFEEIIFGIKSSQPLVATVITSAGIPVPDAERVKESHINPYIEFTLNDKPFYLHHKTPVGSLKRLLARIKRGAKYDVRDLKLFLEEVEGVSELDQQGEAKRLIEEIRILSRINLPPLSVLGGQATSPEAVQSKYLLENALIGRPVEVEEGEEAERGERVEHSAPATSESATKEKQWAEWEQSKNEKLDRLRRIAAEMEEADRVEIMLLIDKIETRLIPYLRKFEEDEVGKVFEDSMADLEDISQIHPITAVKMKENLKMIWEGFDYAI